MSEDRRPRAVHAQKRHAAAEPVPTSVAVLSRYVQSLDAVPMLPVGENAVVLDLEVGSMMLGEPVSSLSVERFSRLIERCMASAGSDFAFGRWGERRDIYRSDLFVVEDGQPARDVHLGVDVFCAPGTPIIAPLDGRIYARVTNDRELDYGPLLILEHESALGAPFYTLYGHLEGGSTEHCDRGQPVSAGDVMARVGAPPENGNWPPHLHFQLILDLLDLGGDFPGVALYAERDFWLELSPLPRCFFPERYAKPLDGRNRR